MPTPRSPTAAREWVPYQIERIVDRFGDLLETGRPVPEDALRPDTAYIMASLLRGVVQRGTAVRASSLGWPLGGKTGTMDEYTDAWFVGFDPDITVGVWIGYDEKKTLGDDEQGARVALPIWIDFMRAAVEGRGKPRLGSRHRPILCSGLSIRRRANWPSRGRVVQFRKCSSPERSPGRGFQ